MKTRINTLFALCILPAMTAALLLSSASPGACQVPISPGTIAFARDIAINYTYDSIQIYAVSSKGTNLTPLTQAQSRIFDFYPSWSPDRRYIVFVSRNTSLSTFTVTMMLADGSQRMSLATFTETINRPVWSPDGRWIAFGVVTGQGTGIYLLDMNAKKRLPVLLYGSGSAGVASLPTWRPDSQRLAFNYYDNSSRFTDIYCINVDGSGLTNLTNTPNVSEGSPTWGPNGKFIAYVQGYPQASWGDMYGDIYLMEADGSNRRPVTYTGGYCFGSPSWSPDGEMIAYSARASSGYNKIFATIPDNGGTVQITSGLYHDLYPSWRR